MDYITSKNQRLTTNFILLPKQAAGQKSFFHFM